MDPRLGSCLLYTSIMGEVKYVVNLNTGVTVKAVNVCVDSVTV